ncbi:MAG: hypothetical protein J6T96_11425 [Bacteroidales bacterium]|nr:hypothetical protein [Bacteroidales bacterium]MBO7463193.1 hypothetical protein [Bacteroidales bacterium]MBO7567206.1 hypothetical protein [Bacteroidales bacterium]
MTRLILLIAAVLMSGVLRAQHIHFMGIPIEGTMEEFAAKLEGKGFKKITRNGLRGTFAGYNCNILLNTTGASVRKSDNVANITVRFNEYEIGSMDIFHNLSKWLSVKYGAYDECQDYYIKDSNGDYKISINRVWCNEYGTIVLNDGGKGGKCIELTYIDRENTTGNSGGKLLEDL